MADNKHNLLIKMKDSSKCNVHWSLEWKADLHSTLFTFDNIVVSNSLWKYDWQRWEIQLIRRNKYKKSGEIISKPLRVWRWCETVMVARVGTTTADCAGDPIGTPESPQSAAERRTANKCCQTPTKQDFSPELKTRFLAGRQKDFLWQRHTYLGKRHFRDSFLEWVEDGGDGEAEEAEVKLPFAAA